MDKEERENLIKSIAAHLRDEADCSHDDPDAIEASEEQASEIVSFYIEPLLAAKDEEIERLKEIESRINTMNDIHNLTSASKKMLEDQLLTAEQTLEKVREIIGDILTAAETAITENGIKGPARDGIECALFYAKEQSNKALALLDKGEKGEER